MRWGSKQIRLGLRYIFRVLDWGRMTATVRSLFGRPQHHATAALETAPHYYLSYPPSFSKNLALALRIRSRAPIFGTSYSFSHCFWTMPLLLGGPRARLSPCVMWHCFGGQDILSRSSTGIHETTCICMSRSHTLPLKQASTSPCICCGIAISKVSCKSLFPMR